MTEYLTAIELLAIHADQIERYGGAHGIRDRGALEAALFRPQSGYYQDIIEEAAALWESLAMNHPFIDGNKRVAFAATLTFLAINQKQITASPEAIGDFILSSLERGQFDYERIAAWLRQNVI